MYRVLFVCTGNTCRSPMAVGALLDDLGADRDRVAVTSAGTAAREGQPATDPAIKTASREGVDLKPHRSRRITGAMLGQADLVLVMESGHLGGVLALGSDPHKTHVLSDWPEPGEPGLQISDPFGGSTEAYEECWRRIRRHIRRLVPQLRETIRARSA